MDQTTNHPSWGLTFPYRDFNEYACGFADGTP